MDDTRKGPREERLQVMLQADEIRAIDDFRFEKRMPSRAAAIRELLRCGLADQSCGVDEGGRRSRDFGVIAPARNKK